MGFETERKRDLRPGHDEPWQFDVSGECFWVMMWGKSLARASVITEHRVSESVLGVPLRLVLASVAWLA